MQVTPEQVKAALEFAIAGAEKLAAKTETKFDDVLLKFAKPILLSDGVVQLITNLINAQLQKLLAADAPVTSEDVERMVAATAEAMVQQYLK